MPARKSKSKPTDLVARSVTIVDEFGEGQIYLSADSKMGAQIHFLNGNGPGLHIDLVQGKPSIVFWSSKKMVRLSMGCDDTTAGLMIHDSEGKPAAIYAMDPKGNIKQGTYKKCVSPSKKKKISNVAQRTSTRRKF